ncbi:MAG: flagellin, partial [Pseudomonadota bacterium]
GKIVSANEENVDRATLQNEIEQLRGQITSIVDAAQFNGQNLLVEGEDISILSSLNRNSAGEVTSGSINVSARDFSANSGTAGVEPSGKNGSLSGTGITADDDTLELTSAAGFLSDAADNYTVTIDGVEIAATLQNLEDAGTIAVGATVATDEDVANYIAGVINGTNTGGPDLNFQGVVATVGDNGGNAQVTISSTSSEDITIASAVVDNTGTGVVQATGLTAGTLSAVSGETNERQSMGIDLVDANASAANQVFEVTVGDNTFTFTNDASNPANTGAAAIEIVDALNADALSQGVTDLVFEVDTTTATQINVVNLNSTTGYEVTFSTDFGTNAGNVVQDAPEVQAATAGSVSVDVGGQILEGDSFSVTIGDTTSTYVAGANEDVNDVIRGLQNVIAAEGPANVQTALTFAADPDSDQASIAISSTTGETVQLTEARGGDQGTGDLYGLSTLDVTTADGATKALTTIENLIQTNIDAQAEFGASERRIEIQSDFMSSLIDSFKSGIGSLVDADLEEASARLQALQVQQQLGVQALSIANQAPQNILALFR